MNTIPHNSMCSHLSVVCNTIQYNTIQCNAMKGNTILYNTISLFPPYLKIVCNNFFIFLKLWNETNITNKQQTLGNAASSEL